MSVTIGIDIGGTHADGVLMSGDQVLYKNKVEVDQEQLDQSIITLLRTLVPEKTEKLDRIHLSTTLCTNAVVTDSLDEVGMLIQAGPGLNPDFFRCGSQVCFLDGAIDHRGHLLKEPDPALIGGAIDQFLKNNLVSVGIVTKFSHRNNTQEQHIHDCLAGHFPYLSMGHRLSGLPNFPRRVYSTWLNAALKSGFMAFKKALERGFQQLDLACPCSILKADGGTIPFAAAADFPAESVHSGPSASVMGCLALQESVNDAILLDIGGTTTDIAILSEGSPLLEPYGISIGGRPTLIRALNTRSIGLGGDSQVSRNGGDLIIGPRRLGAPMTFGGPGPTPTDALVAAGLLAAGNRELANRAMHQLDPESPPEQTARRLLEVFAAQIRQTVHQFLEEIYSRPVYTVAALLNRRRIEPVELIAVGGPAEALRQHLADAFGLPCLIPPHFEVANAIGAARTRPTLQATLYADTARGSLSIPETGVRETLSPGFSMAAAQDRLAAEIASLAGRFGITELPPVDFLEPQEMNTVQGFRTAGKIISLKAQIRPGLQPTGAAS